MFSSTIVITGDGPSTNVCFSTNVGITYIGKMIGFRPFTDVSVFDLNKIANLSPLTNNRARAQARIGADHRSDAHL